MVGVHLHVVVHIHIRHLTLDNVIWASWGAMFATTMRVNTLNDVIWASWSAMFATTMRVNTLDNIVWTSWGAVFTATVGERDRKGEAYESENSCKSHFVV